MLDEAERRFARDGVEGVTTREIVEAAGQRNASAISYHFGSRQGLLGALLARRGGPVDEERGRRRAALGHEPSPGELVACLVEPYAALLSGDAGRSYLRIVAQLRGRFSAWRVESDAATTVHLAAVLDELERRVDAPPPVGRERILALIVLLTGTVAERARRIDEGAELDLDHDAFVANLVAMGASLIEA
ncbi:MAG TPA: TetR family transcriptional regulator [Aquihabitans sp.]|nr:TetR family transcriptional regulator [Aquihabitans sp.]